MKTVVFGGSGFLGSHVADSLSDHDHEVTIFDKVKSLYLRKDQKMVVGDILDQDLIKKTIRGVTYVYHFAGIADLRKALENPVETVKNNILGTTFILDACKESKIKRFLFASTIYVYSELGSFYRSSKQSCELLIENYHKVYGLNYTILRYGSLYGRRANNFNFIHNAIKQAILEKRITRDGSGNEIRDYINVLDAARSSVEILDEKYNNKYIIISGTQTLKVRDLLNMINEILGNEIEIQYSDHRDEDHYEVTPYAFRPRVAQKYVPTEYHDLGQGILDCIYDVYKKVSKSADKAKLDIVLPDSAEC